MIPRGTARRRRLALRVLAPPLLAALSLGAWACGGPGPEAGGETGGPPTPSPAPEGVSRAATRDGVVVTVLAWPGRVTAGEDVRLQVRVQNVGPGVVSWQSGGCELLDGFSLSAPPVAPPPAGRAWPGIARTVKWAATAGEAGVRPIMPADVAPDVTWGCPSDLRVEEIAPGQAIMLDARWTALQVDGTPAPGGAYWVGYRFPLLGRVPKERVADPMASSPIGLELPIVVDPLPFTGIPSTLAIDAALADPRVARWIEETLTPQSLGGASIQLVDGRWRLTIRLTDDGETVVTVDPATGTVVDVRLAG